jgi:hypothetical protein
MSTEPSSICPICGNTRTGRACLNCRKMGSSRRKRWRTGDAGGKRLERRQVGRRTVAAGRVKTARRPPPRRPAAAPAAERSAARNLAEALDGTWREKDGRVVIALDLKRGLYRSQRPDRPWSTEVPLRLGSVEGHAISFYREEKRISGLLENDGLLTLMADNQLFRFVCVERDQDVRVCPACYSRTARDHKSCPVCGWRYPKRLRPTDY